MYFLIFFLIPLLLFVWLFKPNKKIVFEDSSDKNTRFSGFLRGQEMRGKILENQIQTNKSPIVFFLKNIIKIFPDFRWYNIYFENNSYYIVGEKEIKGESPYLNVKLNSFPQMEYKVETGKCINFPYDSEKELSYFIGFGEIFPNREYLEKVSTRDGKGNVKITTKVNYKVYARPTLFAVSIQFILFLFAYWAIVLLIIQVLKYYKFGI